MPQSYRSATVCVQDLPDETVRDMASLYLQHYDGTSEALFRKDLSNKHEVILLFCDGELVGFTALEFFAREWNGRPIRIVFSGDTIVRPDHWGQQRLAFAWISRVGRFRRKDPLTPVFWFLLVKGHRTFRYLPVFSKTFFPHWTEARLELKGLADLLATERFGDEYKPASGVVQFKPSRGHLRDGIAAATREEMAKPSVKFFLERNPGYRLGHELVCICELDSHNLKPLAARLFEKDFEDITDVAC